MTTNYLWYILVNISEKVLILHVGWKIKLWKIYNFTLYNLFSNIYFLNKCTIVQSEEQWHEMTYHCQCHELAKCFNQQTDIG